MKTRPTLTTVLALADGRAGKARRRARHLAEFQPASPARPGGRADVAASAGLRRADAGAPAILPGQAPSDRRRRRLPGSALSRSVPACLTYQAAHAAPGAPFGHIPGHAQGPLLTRKGP